MIGIQGAFYQPYIQADKSNLPQFTKNNNATPVEGTGLTQEQSLAIKNAIMPAVTFKALPYSVELNAPVETSKTEEKGFSSCEEISAHLLAEYGIESEFTSLDVAKMMLDAVEDFVKYNDKDMFQGLKIVPFEDEDRDYFWSTKSDYNTNKFELGLNNSFNKEQLEEYMQSEYDEAYLPTNDPKYSAYESLAEFLNFRYNPYAYVSTTKIGGNQMSNLTLYTGRTMGSASINSMARFDSVYIASRMCGIRVPDVATRLFVENCGAKLNYPESKEVEITGIMHDFSTTEEAEKYLKEKYDIEAEFANVKAANLTVGAIEDFITLNDNPDMFKGLVIKKEVDSRYSVIGSMSASYDYRTGTKKYAHVNLNQAYDWGRHEEIAERNYEEAHYASKNPKYSIYHELAHWLDFQTNPEQYSRECDRSKQLFYGFTEDGKRHCGRVSGYAGERSLVEFRAEYVAARMCGREFPKCVNDTFLTCWKGPNLELVYPKID